MYLKKILSHYSFMLPSLLLLKCLLYIHPHAHIHRQTLNHTRKHTGTKYFQEVQKKTNKNEYNHIPQIVRVLQKNLSKRSVGKMQTDYYCPRETLITKLKRPMSRVLTTILLSYRWVTPRFKWPSSRTGLTLTLCSSTGWVTWTGATQAAGTR